MLDTVAFSYPDVHLFFILLFRFTIQNAKEIFEQNPEISKNEPGPFSPFCTVGGFCQVNGCYFAWILGVLSMIFEEKIVFSKRKTPKFSRLRRGYTPRNPKIFRACGAATTQTIIQNVSHIVQKVIIQKY